MSRRQRAADIDPSKEDLRWWKGDDTARKIFDLAARVAKQCARRRAEDLFHACLYDDTELASMIQGSQAVASFTPQTMTANIVRRQVDAYVAQISESRPLPMALTSGGSYSEQRRAKAASKFFEGALDTVGYYKLRPIRHRDAAIFGDGFAHNYRVGRKIFHKRRMPWEIQVDPFEGQHGEPMSLTMNHYVDRLVLCDRFPKKADAIRKSKTKDADDRWSVGYDNTSDIVLVKEPWRLPSRDGSGDGHHAIAVSEALLEKDEYERDYFPISRVMFSPPLIGWRGEGLVKELAGLQYEVNAIGLRLQEQGYMTGSYVLLEDGSGIETDTLDNGALTVVRYRGTPPQWQNPMPWHPQFFEYYLRLRGEFASDLTGLSSLAVRGEKPGGLDSGKALRVHKDILSGNFVTQGRDDERDCIDTAWQLFDLMEEIEFDPDIDEESRSYEVKVQVSERGKAALKKTDFKAIRMAREDMTLKTFPTSFLSSTPEDKWSQVAEMAKAGLFSEDELLTLLDFPDVERVLNLRNAGRRVIESIVEKFLDDGTPPNIVPEPTMNLDLAVVIGTLAYLEAKWLDEAPEANTSALLGFVMAAKKMRDEANAPPNMAPPDMATEEGALPPPDGGVGEPMLPPPGPEELYAPPDGQPLPANAVAPEALPVPGV